MTTKNTASHLSNPPAAVARRHAAISRRAKAIANRLNSNVGECDNAEDHAALLLNREEANRRLREHARR
tara:strand:- start:208 stop:414 length:207 start_codon:yes stop_codon:yes gene_type:complete